MALRFSFAFLCCLLLLLPARAAMAQPPAAAAVYVVEVNGDRLDAARVRRGCERPWRAS